MRSMLGVKDDHLAMCSGSVIASHTRSGGAAMVMVRDTENASASTTVGGLGTALMTTPST